MAAELSIERMREGYEPTRGEIVRMVLTLSVPAILSELSTTLMQYIDAGMVGGLGARATAAIGLIESSVWLLDGWVMCVATGFTVQVAQFVGAGRYEQARSVFRQSIAFCAGFGFAIAVLGMALSGYLPALLGGEPSLRADSSAYFFVCSCALLPITLGRLGTGMLQCSGDMHTPSVLNVLVGVLDVCFNALLIGNGWDVALLGFTLRVPGFGLGVVGAALGTLLAQVVVAVLMLWCACVRSPILRLSGGGSWLPRASTVRAAARVGSPMLLERTIMSFAYIAGTVVVAPLGTVSVAANSLAVTAEAVCYMPGIGVSVAATTLVGQAVGAARKDLAMRFARFSTFVGMALMAATGAAMFVLAPNIMGMLTSSAQVRALGAEVLRIEAFVEPLFGASIVAAGALRGAADTLVPSIIVAGSMWGVRIVLATVLAPLWGLRGVWIAMAFELCLRGTMFLVRLLRGRWLDRESLAGESVA